MKQTSFFQGTQSKKFVFNLFLMQQQLGKTLIIIGGLVLFVGLLFYFFDRIPFFGKMPGDIVVKKNFTFYFPLATSIILSILLTLFLYLINRFR